MRNFVSYQENKGEKGIACELWLFLLFSAPQLDSQLAKLPGYGNFTLKKTNLKKFTQKWAFLGHFEREITTATVRQCARVTVELKNDDWEVSLLLHQR